MNDKELADAVVALGVGGNTDNRTGDGKHYYEMRKHEYGVWTFDYVLETSLFVRDWRVAGACLEASRHPDRIMDIAFAETGSFIPEPSLPRAINEACVAALTDSQ